MLGIILYSIEIYKLWTVDISQYNITQYCTQHHNIECKTFVTVQTYERHPYIILMGKLWVSFVIYLNNKDHKI